MKLMDDAAGQLPLVNEEVSDLRIKASDKNLNISERLEAFEDIIASEVGDTLFARARNIERETGLRQLYLKFEGGNPSGTQKDRIAFAQARDAMRRGYDTVSVATCGNYGVAVAFASHLAGLSCRIFIPSSYHTKREEEMHKWGAEIIRAGADYEDSISISSSDAAEKDHYDANPGTVNADLQLMAYGEIAYEIYDELRDAPAAIAVPVSNGTTLAGIYRGFLQLYRRGKTSRIPRLIAGSSSKMNPITVSFMKGLETCVDLNPEEIRESIVNEPLINWHSIDGNVALDAIFSSKGWASDVSDRKMLYYANYLRKNEGLSVMPASTAGLAALIKLNSLEPFAGDRYVALLTGRR